MTPIHRRCLLVLSFVLGLVFSGSEATAVIAFDNSSNGVNAGSQNSLSWSHILNSGSGNNRLVVVGLQSESSTPANQVPSGVTFNGVAMTAVSAGSVTNGSNRVDLYYILDADLPAAAGTYTITAGFGGNLSHIVCGAVSLTGADQAAADAVNTGTATSPTASVSATMTTLVNNSWIVSCVGSSEASTDVLSASPGTSRWTNYSTSSGAGQSTLSVATAGSGTVTWSATGAPSRLLVAAAAFAPAPTVTLSGTVFEDATYGGGSGRTKAASSGVGRSGARVEIFDNAGNLNTALLTDANGAYSASVTSNSTYTVRVVNSSVTSSLGGTSLLPVQTYRTTATTGSAVSVTDRVGGEVPTKADAGNGSTTLAALTTASATPQSITAVTVGGSNITGLDFGFNFSTIVNTNDTGQGSLRQFITNANALSGTQTSVFMISDGSAHNGLRSGLTNQLTSGVARITVATALPQITGTLTLDGTSQTTHVGNTNSGTLGTGGTVGTDAVSLPTLNRPEVEIVGSSSIALGLDIAAASTVIKGLAIRGFGSAVDNCDIRIGSVAGVEITECAVGITASSLSLPASNPTGGSGIGLLGATSASIHANVIGFTAYNGINCVSTYTPTSCTIANNEIRGCTIVESTGEGVLLRGSSHTVEENLLVANKGCGLDAITTGAVNHTIQNNTITGNGVGTATVTRQNHGIRLLGNGTTVYRNRIHTNFGPGVTVRNASTGNKISQNSIHSNGTITNDSGEAATGQVGIDLHNTTDEANAGTAPYYTINDSGDGDSGANNLLNAPVLSTATISGSNITVVGWARPGSIIEFFVSDGDASGFGEGQTYVGVYTEGSGSDGLATSSSYSNPVNGLNQGADTTNRFSFTFSTPSGVTGGTKLTATATDASNNTSEFSGQVTVVGASLSGTVFEDVTFAGGAGRNLATASGSARSGARVELFDASGNYVSAATTDGSGLYTFTGVTTSTTYTVRVVNSTVTSSLGGSNLLPVQTYRTTATSGSAVAVTDRVGGEDPAKADAGNGSTTLAALTTGSLTPQSLTSVTVGTSDITGLDFGFNFCTIVNTNDSGQGSLRQFITNANALSGSQSSLFMITDGSAHNGLRAGLTNQLTNGVAIITLSSELPQITAGLTLDGTSQTSLIGNTNSGTAGAGGTVGTDASTLSTVNKPEVEIVGSSSVSFGLDIAAASCTVKGLSIHGCGSAATHADLRVTTGGTGFTLTECVIGATASSFTLPSGATGGTGLLLNAGGGTVSNNLIGFTGFSAVSVGSAASGWTIENNELRGGGRSDAAYGGIDLDGSGTALTGNLIAANKGQGVDTATTASGWTLLNNTVTGNGVGTSGTPETAGLRIRCSTTTVDRNIVQANYGAGIQVASGTTGVRITKNSVYDNGTIVNDASTAATGQIGIDLLSAADTAATGTAPFYTINDDGDGDSGGNNLLNFPVIDSAVLVGSNLVVTGWAPAGSTVEFFVSDSDPSNFGEGRTYLTSLAEGGGSDTDAGASSYSGNVNCFAQGAGTSANRFKFTFAKPGSVSVLSRLVATATDTSSNTSEFSGHATVYLGALDFTLVKSSTVSSDPVNATTNPKAIPGAVLTYNVVVQNAYPVRSDADSFVYTVPVPADAELYVGDLGAAGSGPVGFANGATSSGLTYTFASLANNTDDISFSNNSGSTWDYTPTPDANGFDSAVTNVRINPKGSFEKSSCGANPSCTLQYRIRIK